VLPADEEIGEEVEGDVEGEERCNPFLIACFIFAGIPAPVDEKWCGILMVCFLWWEICLAEESARERRSDLWCSGSWGAAAGGVEDMVVGGGWVVEVVRVDFWLLSPRPEDVPGRKEDIVGEAGGFWLVSEMVRVRLMV